VSVIKYIDLYANICHNGIKAKGLLRGDFDLKWFKNLRSGSRARRMPIEKAQHTDSM
jgi:hypothetical protein